VARERLRTVVRPKISDARRSPPVGEANKKAVPSPLLAANASLRSMKSIEFTEGSGLTSWRGMPSCSRLSVVVVSSRACPHVALPDGTGRHPSVTNGTRPLESVSARGSTGLTTPSRRSRS